MLRSSTRDEGKSVRTLAERDVDASPLHSILRDGGG